MATNGTGGSFFELSTGMTKSFTSIAERLTTLTKQFVEGGKSKTPAENVQGVLQVMEIMQQCSQDELLRHGYGSKEVKIDETIQKSQQNLKEFLSRMRPHKWLNENAGHHHHRDTSEMTDEEAKAYEEKMRQEEEERARVAKEELVKLHEYSLLMVQFKVFEVLIKHIEIIDFEAKKDLTALFRDLLKSPCEGGFNADYVRDNFETIVIPLLQGYKLVEFSSFCCGQMLRECVKHQSLSKMILESQHMDELFTAVNLEQFDIATDAFYTLHALLTTHKKVVAEFLVERYVPFFSSYTQLLSSSQYVAKRQALNMLGDILLDRANFSVMTVYISDVENLKQMMNLLRDRSKAIQADAFQIFKVFVGNPNKTKPVINILVKNQSKLLSFLQKLQIDDPQFEEDKHVVMEEISKLVPVPDSPPLVAQATTAAAPAPAAATTTTPAAASTSASPVALTSPRGGAAAPPPAATAAVPDDKKAAVPDPNKPAEAQSGAKSPGDAPKAAEEPPVSRADEFQ